MLKKNLAATLRRSSAGSSAARRACAAANNAIQKLAAQTSASSSGASSRSFSTQQEIKSIIEKRAIAAKKELATLAQWFERYDGEGTGALNATQLQRALKDLELPSGEVDVAQLFKELDANNDGSIELAEWLDNLPKGTRIRILDQEEKNKNGGWVQFTMPEVKVMYTQTDEAPMLATFSLLPILRAFCRHGGVKIMKRDISVAARIRAAFPDFLHPDQRVEDELQLLGDLAKTPAANIIKLPNVSASVPQLLGAIKELQAKGYNVPDYPATPASKEDEEVRARYAKVLGSAVNPVLREGNSDRRVAKPVKEYAQENPHKVGAWTPDSKSHVHSMSDGDFFSSETSWVNGSEPDSVKIVLEQDDGTTTVLKNKTVLLPGEIIDSSRMSIGKLREMLEESLQTVEAGTVWSLHLKATMMKISDPIMFGHAVQVFYKDVFEKHGALFAELNVNPNNGLGDVYAKLEGHPKEEEVVADIMKVYETRPEIAFVDSNKGITNLHVPSDVIVDASMAAAVRDSGRMWDKNDSLQDSKFVIPDRSYAGIYQAIIDDCKLNGKLDVTTVGATSNVGLMAAKAEEYGSHDKTFEIPASGTVKVQLRSKEGVTLFEHPVEKGDIWRMCQTKDEPIQDWVKLAVNRARASNAAAIFWLDEHRAHDANVIKKVQEYLKLYDTEGLDLSILPPAEAMKKTLERARAGKDTITVTGNVLRDYLTDLFPILELGTSAKMLSIVPLLAGGGMFETGAGGSAPKHVQQFLKEGHLRWDSLGEFLAMAVSMEDLGQKTENKDAIVLAQTLNTAVGKLLTLNKSPKRQVMQLDNRGSHFYLSLYWAEALAGQSESQHLQERFKSVRQQLKENESRILGELIAAEGRKTDVGGYWMPDPFLASQAMRPSPTFNSIIDATMAASGF
ncbi:unnamed protein product [Amoebophrya sp. A120]|nr:unnamed protein product [Amoebophrya sp. A120]|eukprot:GSA120T00006483001.1